METDRINDAIVTQEINYYTTVCALKQNEGLAIDKAIEFIDLEKNNARVHQMNFHLGEYYFRHEKFADAIERYEAANIVNLSNREIADLKFHQGYSYFTLQKFTQAKPLFNTIRLMRNDPSRIRTAKSAPRCAHASLRAEFIDYRQQFFTVRRLLEGAFPNRLGAAMVSHNPKHFA